jgi:hypothetical protein
MKKMTILLIIVMLFGFTTAWAKGTGDGKLVLLIDGSGSMKGKEKEIKTMTRELLNKHNDIDIYLFNDTIKAIEKKDIDDIDLSGGTNLSFALEYLMKKKRFPKALILLTDGRPNNAKKVDQAIKKLKNHSKTVICSSFIGDGNKPEILTKISDVSIVQSSLTASLGECLNHAKIKEALPFSFREETEKLPTDFFTLPEQAFEQKEEIKKSPKKGVKKRKKVLIIMFDASGENYSCDLLRKSNFRKVQERISLERLKEDKVAAVYMGVFSRNSEILNFTTIYSPKYRGKTDRKRYQLMSKSAKFALETVKKNMHSYYVGIEGSGKKVHYGKDIVGALKKVLSCYEDEKLEEFENVEVIMVSDMIQSVNPERTKDMLQKKEGGIKFPDNMNITIFGKQLTCEEKYSEMDKQNHINKIKLFWKNMLKTKSKKIDFFTNY